MVAVPRCAALEEVFQCERAKNPSATKPTMIYTPMAAAKIVGCPYMRLGCCDLYSQKIKRDSEKFYWLNG